ncbi:MAG: FKBP-type peptidyl-prolyl cis-trans isomerase [Candidatus Jordarchaeales archaeon]
MRDVAQSSDVISKGDFVLVDLTGRVKDGEIFETTLKDVAEKEGIYDENEVYEPRLVVVGENWVFPEIDSTLESMKIGETKTVEIKNAFGEWKRENVKSFSVKEFLKNNINPKPGMRVRIGGRLATIKKVGGGRVRVDMNHPYAGKTIVYEVSVVKKITDNNEKIKALIKRRMPKIPLEKVKIEVGSEGKSITIEIPKETFFVDGVQFVKFGLARDLKKYIGFEEVIFIERYSEELLSGS